MIFPIAKVGRRARLRHFECLKDEGIQDVKIIEDGDISAHYGSALADALIFSDLPEDLKQFFLKYGVYPSTILKYRNCNKLLIMFNWKGGVTEFEDNPVELGLFNSAFQLFIKFLDKASSEEEVNNGLRLGTNGGDLYDKMRTSYGVMYAKRRAGRQKGRKSGATS